MKIALETPPKTDYWKSAKQQCVFLWNFW